jgi:hypothetical protein
VPWGPLTDSSSPVFGQNHYMDQLSPDLLDLLEAHTPVGTVILTLSTGKPNRIVELSSAGAKIATERSSQDPQLVPAWMIQTAWNHLKEHGELTNRELVATDGLNVKRSSAVCALLARIPGVKVHSRGPITLNLDPNHA